MRRNYSLDFVVGLFVLSGIVAFVLLSLKVSGLQDFNWNEEEYVIKASFANIGGLKIRSRVTMAGVNVGRVTKITLDSENTYDAIVEMSIESNLRNKIPEDSIASIRTSGLIGDNFIAITPGGSEDFLQNGNYIFETHSALVLEDIISKYLFSKTEEAKTGDGNNSNTNTNNSEKNTADDSSSRLDLDDDFS
jgi:phospholipid/cholesterol/gamma-HCH transport system substrate-binding protein